jgi:3-hydroxyacyl-[acyl-carrier-protein] dehydratase
MASKQLFDLTRVDMGKVEVPIEEIRRVNRQRYEFEQVDGIFRAFPEEGVVVGYKDVRPDEFWVRGHVPGMPLFPGVLMIEAAAQLCSYYKGKYDPSPGFFGFGGVEEVRFRASVKPGEKLILVGKAVQIHPRRSIFATQAFVNGRLVFEATIIGITIKDPSGDGSEASA